MRREGEGEGKGGKQGDGSSSAENLELYTGERGVGSGRKRIV